MAILFAFNTLSMEGSIKLASRFQKLAITIGASLKKEALSIGHGVSK